MSHAVAKPTLKLNSRFALIEAILVLYGEFKRMHVRRGFDLAPATATRIIGEYCQQHPDQIFYDESSKSYKASESFSPTELAKFNVDARRFYDSACVVAGCAIVQTRIVIV